ncbi:hypothetical protein [Spiroplasma endosymbiont of Zeiraphera isertana]|uniref:hypothetical protein n=1 Tax=Spiroplasma endosymbiont of Zeiraphera isertana TaxID=3066313 RepID=UPI00313C686A
MKYFNPSYWFKLWVLSAPLFNDKTQGINAKSIDNKKIKDWVSKNTTNISFLENQELTLANNQTSLLNLPLWNSNLNIHNQHHKHRHQKSRNKRDFYEKEKIEFFNNNFFYKFNVNYDSGEKSHSSGGGFQSNVGSDIKVLTDDWTKYAKNWNEFQQKFPEVEFINFKAEMLLHGKNLIERNLKMSTNLIKEFRKEDIHDSKWNKCISWISSANTNNGDYSSSDKYKVVKHIFKEHYTTGSGNGLFGSGGGVELAIRLYRENNKIMIQNCYYVGSSSFTSPWVKLKYDSIRLVGEIDVNTLFSLTVEKAQQFDIWASSQERELKGKKEDPNYNKTHLLNEENSFKENFKLWLLQIRHDYIQDLININQNNEIINLKSEIDDIKSRLDKLEKPKTCLDNICDSFKKNTLSNAPSDTWNSIKENSESPLKVIIKKSGKAFATGLLTGVAKGSALGILSCVSDSLLSSRKKREIFDINNLEEKNDLKNITKWTDEFTNSINNEQHLPILNNTNFVKSNITTL